MPIPRGAIPYEYKKMLNKFAMLLGIIIVIYALLWILAKIGLIPIILFAVFPQIVLLLIGGFIFYQAWIKRKQY